MQRTVRGTRGEGTQSMSSKINPTVILMQSDAWQIREMATEESRGSGLESAGAASKQCQHRNKNFSKK